MHRALTAALVGAFELFEGRATDDVDHPQDLLSFLLERFAEKHDLPELASRTHALLQHDPTFAEDHLLDWYTDPAGCQRWRSLPQFLGERRLMHRLEIEPGDDAPVLP